jgi:hypothetical protein
LLARVRSNDNETGATLPVSFSGNALTDTTLAPEWQEHAWQEGKRYHQLLLAESGWYWR